LFLEPLSTFLYFDVAETLILPDVTMNQPEIAKQIIAVCRALYARGFVAASDGNVSVRLPNGNILTTPTALNKGRVSESDLVEVTPAGAPVGTGPSPSSELGMHLFIYQHRTDVNAVVHAHPTYATGFATARIPLDQPLYPEVIFGLGAIPLADFATPTTREVADSIAPFVQSSNAILLANHGVVAFGKSLDDAYFKMEKVEHAAHITFVARMLGGEKSLTQEQVGKLNATFKKLRP
jgi:L-fuculose-phosphate aldolase